MEIFGAILFWLGVAVGVVSGVWLLTVAWKESPMWGLGCLVCNIVALVFVITHWAEARRPFLVNLGACALIFLGAMMGGNSFSHDSDDSLPVAGMVEDDDEPATSAEVKKSAPATNPAPARVTNATLAAAAPAPAGTNLPPAGTRRRNRTRTPQPATSPQPATAPPTSTPSTSTTLARKEPEPEPLLLPGEKLPMEILVTSIGADNGSGLRPLQLKISNHTRKTAKQLRVTMIYLDRKRIPLKEWSTSIFDPTPPLTTGSTVELTQPAFFMPMLTETVAVRVESIRFEDGTDWPRR